MSLLRRDLRRSIVSSMVVSFSLAPFLSFLSFPTEQSAVRADFSVEWHSENQARARKAPGVLGKSKSSEFLFQVRADFSAERRQDQGVLVFILGIKKQRVVKVAMDSWLATAGLRGGQVLEASTRTSPPATVSSPLPPLIPRGPNVVMDWAALS